MQQLLDALSSPIRREILWLVRDRELPAGDIAAAFEVTAPTISQHLSVLRQAGLVEMRVDGTFRRYRARADALRGLERLIADERRWIPASLPDDAHHTTATVELVVRVVVDVPAPPHRACCSFTDPELFGAWLGVPVTLVDGRFACTMEWGTRVRGSYDVVSEPSLIAMRWDFDDDNIPVPGDERTAYLRISADGAGSRVEVHQLVGNHTEADFMKVVWTVLLDRMRNSLTNSPPTRRRPKRKHA
jgi:DNA-binding transcriptional ArsR family regulator